VVVILGVGVTMVGDALADIFGRDLRIAGE
jgi:hypothetical protein